MFLPLLIAAGSQTNTQLPEGGIHGKDGSQGKWSRRLLPLFSKMILNVYQPKEKCVSFVKVISLHLNASRNTVIQSTFALVLVLMRFHLLLILSIFFTFCIFVLITSSCLTLSFHLLQQTEGFKKRWFTLDQRRLMYFKDPLVRQP